ncbi:MAG: hypothetical protein ACF8K1_05755 [Phycisphaerales bacterium JB047]
MMNTWKFATLASALIVMPALADWDEGVDGDLSDSEATPTFIAMSAGDNFVSGVIGGVSGVGDFNDAFTFSIGAGQTLEAIDVVTYIVVGGNTSSGFNMAFGNSWDGDFNNPAVIASIAMDTSYVGTNLLDDPLFGGPLGEGDYTVGLREGTEGQIYSFNFRVTPTPGTTGLLGLGALVGLRRRR